VSGARWASTASHFCLGYGDGRYPCGGIFKAGTMTVGNSTLSRNKAALLSGAMALLYPSLHEGFGFLLFEAQACGTPVLASTTSSLPEVAGDSALLVDSLDVEGMVTAISRLATDPLLRAELTDLGGGECEAV